MRRDTIFSPCRQWRYTLWREWDMFNPSYLMCIGLNPSTADETQDDPTIRRVISFAKAWGFGGLCMTNLFAWRDTKPVKMMRADEPVGLENNAWLHEVAQGAGMILAAWGKHGVYMHRADTVRELLARAGCKLHCLRFNGDGSPEHPLYVPGSAVPQVYGLPLAQEVAAP